MSHYWMTPPHLSVSRSLSAVLRAGLEPARACTSSTRLCQLGYRSLSTHIVEPEGFEPSSPGCKPSILPVRRRSHLFSALREGFEPSSPAFGGPCFVRF